MLFVTQMFNKCLLFNIKLNIFLKVFLPCTLRTRKDLQSKFSRQLQHCIASSMTVMDRSTLPLSFSFSVLILLGHTCNACEGRQLPCIPAQSSQLSKNTLRKQQLLESRGDQWELTLVLDWSSSAHTAPDFLKHYMGNFLQYLTRLFSSGLLAYIHCFLTSSFYSIILHLDKSGGLLFILPVSILAHILPTKQSCKLLPC